MVEKELPSFVCANKVGHGQLISHRVQGKMHVIPHKEITHMARARKSHAPDEEKMKTRIEPAFGSCGDNPHVIYCDLKRDGEEHPRVLVKNFRAKYAAKFMLTKLIHNDTWEKCDPVGGRKGIITSSGIRITMFGDDLFMLLEYEPTDAELRWRDEQTEKHVLQFKYGSIEEGKPQEEPINQRLIDEHPEFVKRVTRTKPEKVVKEKKPKIDTSGMVSANDIAKELKVEGREVRGVLRSMKLEKPAHGWAWPKDEAAKIKEKVSVALKEGKAKKK